MTRRLYPATVLVLLVLAVNVGRAESGRVTAVPAMAAMARHGVTFEVDPRGADGNGFRPITVVVKTANGMPSPSDRQFRVRLTPDHDYWQSSYIYETLLDLPQGSASAKTTLLIRQNAASTTMGFEVSEGGRRFEECRTQILFSARREYTEMWPTMLFIDNRAPQRSQQVAIRNSANATALAEFVDFRAFASLSPVADSPRRDRADVTPAKQFYYGSEGRPRSGDVLGELLNESKCSMLPFTDLPESWIHLSNYDVSFISLSDLNLLATEQPKRAQALADWVRTGRSLIVYGTRSEAIASALNDIDRQIGSEYRDWEVATTTLRDKLEEYDLANSNNGSPSYGTLAKSELSFARERECGFGQVIYVDGDPFQMTYKDRVAILNVIGIEGWSWRERNGVSMRSTNSTYWSQLIPGLGLPPVNLFLVSVTAFVIAVGPLSYYMLRRRRKLFLIMLIAPTASLLLIVGLVLFAIMSDGFGMKVRVRGVTFLDQRAGRGAATSYQTYYSALGGGAQLAFPLDAAVYPVRYQPNDRSNQGLTFLTQWDDQQRLARGFIRPRTMTQFVVNRSAATSMVLEVAKMSAGLELSNGLQSTIEVALIRDAEGRFHWAKNVGEGERAELAEVELKEAWEYLSELSNNAELAPPQGFDELSYRGFSNTYYYGQSADHGFGAPDYTRSLLERRLRDLLNTPENMPRGGFLAIVEDSRLSPEGVDSPHRFSNIDVVYGRWQ